MLLKYPEVITMTEKDREIPVPRAASDARESASGADAATTSSRAFEGSHKQTADTNVEEQFAGQTGAQGASDRFFGDLNRLNAKRTYDAEQSLDFAQRTGSADFRLNMQNLMVQATQNAVETANMISKQAVAHRDIAINSQWTIDKEALEAAVAAIAAKAFDKD